ncbi:hypothetical protein MXB_2393 [Myxobolus squamalis]|nr:hypothetical protein MXB_2393 [Myxobolus squamalis]
MCQYMLW